MLGKEFNTFLTESNKSQVEIVFIFFYENKTKEIIIIHKRGIFVSLLF